MTETETETESTTETDGTETEPTTDEGEDGTLSERRKNRIVRGTNYLVLFGLLVFALVAAVGFYTAVSSAITTWVTREFRPVARAAFNLVVLLLVGAGVVVQIRRLS